MDPLLPHSQSIRSEGWTSFSHSNSAVLDIQSTTPNTSLFSAESPERNDWFGNKLRRIRLKTAKLELQESRALG